MNILLGVTGSISAYKSHDLVRELTKAGHHVKVILSAGAEEFVVPQVYLYLGAEEVYRCSDDFKHPNVLHIDLIKWADTFAIAPLTANTLAKLASGQADDLLSCAFLAYPQSKPLLFFPAMNSGMYHNPIVRNHFKSLTALENLFIHPPARGELACGDVGIGKLPPIEQVQLAIEHISLATIRNKEKEHVLISTGATVSPLDPVRYLTNASSGMTGYHLAKEALKRGMKVTVVAGHYATDKLNLLKEFPDFQLVRAVTPDQMGQALDQFFDQCSYYISSAAVSDIEFTFNDKKMKKADLKNTLATKPSRDILASLIERKKNQKIVGFAAETELTNHFLEEKFNRKPVDLLVGTKVNNGLGQNQEVQGFSVDTANYGLMNSKKEIDYKSLTKNGLACEIYQRITQ